MPRGPQWTGPRRFLESRVRYQTTRIAGRYINARRVAEHINVNYSYVTRILSGDRPNPSVDILEKIADALGMGLDELRAAVSERRQSIQDTKNARRDSLFD